MASDPMSDARLEEIELTRGYVAVVDKADVEAVSRLTWTSHVERRKDGSIRTVYAIASVGARPAKRRTVLMHRFLLGVTDPAVEVDHKDHDGLNNRRSNLRVGTKADNQHNRRLNANSRSGFKGVQPYQPKGRRSLLWRARIKVNGTIQSLGYFQTKEEAAKAYTAKAEQLWGERACSDPFHSRAK